jgi:DNA-directed RNA polymerase subunit K/omega
MNSDDEYEEEQNSIDGSEEVNSINGSESEEEEEQNSNDDNDTNYDEDEDDDEEDEDENPFDEYNINSKGGGHLIPEGVDEDDYIYNENENEVVEEDKINIDEISDDDEDDEDDEDYEEDDDLYIKKFDEDMKKNFILEQHPECINHNYNEILALTRINRDSNGNIIDELHKTISILTKYEKSKIIGIRAKQINNGAKIFIPNVSNEIIDGFLIAQLELEQKRLPFILRRPLPNGASEYWCLRDLEILC